MREILRPAQAGTVESSDIQITLTPAVQGAGIMVELTSPTMQQYGRQIIKLIEQTLKSLSIEDANVHANDKGALDFTIQARVTTAAERATAKGGV